MHMLVFVQSSVDLGVHVELKCMHGHEHELRNPVCFIELHINIQLFDLLADVWILN